VLVKGKGKRVSSFVPNTDIGQNFLKDRNILRILVEEAQLAPEDLVLEIGPGMGVLTEELLAGPCREVIAIELDRRLAPYLEPLAQRHPRLRLHWGDALRFPYGELPEGPNKVIANVPYYITTPLLWTLLECLSGRGLRTLLLMVQKEAAERLVASPGTKARTPLGITLEAMGHVALLRNIPPTAFFPRPSVDSSLVRIVLEKEYAWLPGDSLWRSLLRNAFAQRRKMLRTTLLGIVGKDRAHAEERLSSLAIAPTARAEELETGQWLALHNDLKKRHLAM
jgi:16S rRNA (adenine1518-N6/adenine1519-N6)-dimethyltransferase